MKPKSEKSIELYNIQLCSVEDILNRFAMMLRRTLFKITRLDEESENLYDWIDKTVRLAYREI
jgi:hypothetical protein